MFRWDMAAFKYGFTTPKEMLQWWYVKLGMSTAAIGKKLGVTSPVVLARLRLFGIQPRVRGGNQRSLWKKS